MLSEARALLRIPATERAAPSVWDRVLLVALVVAAIAEGSLRPNLPARGVQIALGIGFAALVALRKSRPLLART